MSGTLTGEIKVTELDNDQLEDFLADNEDNLSVISNATNNTAVVISQSLENTHMEQESDHEEMDQTVLTPEISATENTGYLSSLGPLIDQNEPILNVEKWSAQNRQQPVTSLNWSEPHHYPPYDQAQQLQFYHASASQYPLGGTNGATVPIAPPAYHTPEVQKYEISPNQPQVKTLPVDKLKICEPVQPTLEGDSAKFRLFSNIFNVKPRFDTGNFEFQEPPEMSRGKLKKPAQESGPAISDDVNYVENVKTRQRKCRNALMSKEMAPTRFLYCMGDSGPLKDGGFSATVYSYTKYLAVKAAELNTYGTENRLCSPYADTKSYLMLSVLTEIMKNQPTSNKWWGEIIVS